MNIHLHIERLVVDEAVLGTGRREALQAAVEAELTRLLATGDLQAQWPNGGNIPSLRGGNIQLQQGNNSTQVGTQIAQTVYGAVNSPTMNSTAISSTVTNGTTSGTQR